MSYKSDSPNQKCKDYRGTPCTPFYDEETTFYDTTLATNTTDSVTTVASNITETTTTESTTANVTVSGRVALSIHRFKREEPAERFATAPGRRVLL